MGDEDESWEDEQRLLRREVAEQAARDAEAEDARMTAAVEEVLRRQPLYAVDPADPETVTRYDVVEGEHGPVYRAETRHSPRSGAALEEYLERLLDANPRAAEETPLLFERFLEPEREPVPEVDEAYWGDLRKTMSQARSYLSARGMVTRPSIITSTAMARSLEFWRTREARRYAAASDHLHEVFIDRRPAPRWGMGKTATPNFYMEADGTLHEWVTARILDPESRLIVARAVAAQHGPRRGHIHVNVAPRQTGRREAEPDAWLRALGITTARDDLRDVWSRMMLPRSQHEALLPKTVKHQPGTVTHSWIGRTRMSPRDFARTSEGHRPLPHPDHLPAAARDIRQKER